MVAVAPKAEGAATPSPDRNPVAKGKNENDFARQLKKASSKHTVRQVSQGAGSQREVTTAEPKLLKNSGEQERAGPGAKEEILKSIVLESGETAPPQNQLEKERELCRVPYPLLPEGTEIKPKSVAIESEPVMERNENGASLQEQEVLVLADKLRGNEGSPGEPRLNPATAELSLETPESTSTKLEQEETRISPSRIFELQPEKANSQVFPDSIDIAPGIFQQQLEKAGQVRQASQETTEEELPRSERLSRGRQEPEAQKPAMKVEAQPVRVEKPQLQQATTVITGKENDMPLLNKAAGEPLKAGYDPAALAVLLKAQGKGEKLSGKNKLDYEGNLLLEEETAGAKPNNKDGSIKGEVVSPRIPEAASKAQLDSDITEEFRLGEDDKNQPLKAGGREKEPAELPEYKESGKNMPGFKTEHTLLDNSLRNTGKPIQEKSWVDPEKFMEQVVKKAEVMIKQNLSQMRIQLHPEFLGKMTIKLVLEDGLLTARFITENQQVKNLLDSNLNHLRQNLENQGIRVEKTEVNVQLNNGGLFDGSEGSRQDLWEQPRSYSQYNPAGPGSDAYQASSAGDEVEAGLIDSGETYGLAADGSMNFLI